MTQRGYLGIDAGTQGLSVIFTDHSLKIIETADGHYDMVAGLTDGCYEQRPGDWIDALATAMNRLREKLQDDFQVDAIGISGQMHGEVLVDSAGHALGPARLWCDSRNQAESTELTEKMGVKMPKRITAARWLWTIRNRPEIANLTARVTTPAGWLANQLTGQWLLGIGDAAGMFPIDQVTLDYDRSLLKSFASIAQWTVPLEQMLPSVASAGQDGGTLNDAGAKLLGLPRGLPVAPAEGDQPAALAGSLIGNAGMVSCSFGTSVCANSIGDRKFNGVSPAVDHFCAPDGKPINMVCLRNGTTFMNSVVEMFGAATDGDRAAGFASVMPQVLAAQPDCGGLLALPFMDDEPGLGVRHGGTAMLVGLDAQNSTPGNAVKAALLSTIFNLKLGSQMLDAQGFPRTEIVLSGGLTKTPELGQILADIFDTPVVLLASSEEGTAWGAALLAKFRHQRIAGQADDWPTFLSNHARADQTKFKPNPAAVLQYQDVFQRYRKLVSAHRSFATAFHSES